MYTLHHGDCLAVMPTLEANSVDTIICDLPYGTTSCRWDTVIPFAPMWEQVKRVIKPNGAIVLFGVQPFTSMLVAGNVKCYKHRWVWNKRQPGNFAVAKFMPMSIDEDIVVFTSKGERVNYYPIMTTGKMRTKGGRHSLKNGRGFGGLANLEKHDSDQYFPKSILEFSVTPRQTSLHESQKPVDLLRYLVRTYSLVGQIILDFTMGSGSTGVAALMEGRHFIGIEKDSHYFTVATDRIAQVQPALMEAAD